MAATVTVESVIPHILQNDAVFLDTRSPAEYEHSHIPGALSFPLMSNEERAIIGTIYKQQGRQAAVTEGFRLIGPRFAEFIEKAHQITEGKKVFLYCWRGGMRSGIMAWILSMGGVPVTVIKGGYKAYRHWALSTFSVQKSIAIIGGKTGSRKTELLHELKNNNQYIIDLEELANHKGSAFGALGMPPQPSTEQFENSLALLWHRAPDDAPVWLENESNKIGRCAIPMSLFEQMRGALCYELDVPYEERKQHILKNYGCFDRESLAACTEKIKKRLGGLRLKNALEALEENRLSDWCDIVMEYYDKTYAHSNMQRDANKIIRIATQKNVAQHLIAKSKEIITNGYSN
ncbi:MAG: tRNA 2-selenouridine(34) synthase MnmH [Bacteroidia bacterium]|nr:tRNA 2-selenouridine(34) synthase MnmH [Bacteroidia bacterium]